MLAVAMWLAAAAPHRADRPPNIVVIIADDQGWTDYGFMGHRNIQTPNLDKLATQSLVFRRGYVPSPLCCPSLASLITGRYPHEHRSSETTPLRPRKRRRKPREPRDARSSIAGSTRCRRFRESWRSKGTLVFRAANGGRGASRVAVSRTA